MKSYLTVFRRVCAGTRDETLLATVFSVGAAIDWTKEYANKIAATAEAADPQLGPVCAMQVGEQPPEGMERAA